MIGCTAVDERHGGDAVNVLDPPGRRSASEYSPTPLISRIIYTHIKIMFWQGCNRFFDELASVAAETDEQKSANIERASSTKRHGTQQ